MAEPFGAGGAPESLTRTAPGLGLTPEVTPRGAKQQIARKTDIDHLPLVSAGGLVRQGGYLGEIASTPDGDELPPKSTQVQVMGKRNGNAEAKFRG